MRNGKTIVKFLRENANKITGIKIDGNPETGFIEFTLLDETTQKFDWDEEDQAMFQCAMNGTEWQPGMKGLTELTITSSTTEFSLTTDRPVPVIINGQPLEEWGRRAGSTYGLWRKAGNAAQQPERTNNQSTNNNNNAGNHHFAGLSKGWFKKM